MNISKFTTLLAMGAAIITTDLAAQEINCGDITVEYGNSTITLNARFSPAGYAIEPYNGTQIYFAARTNIYDYDTQEALVVAYFSQNDIRYRVAPSGQHERNLNHRDLTSIGDLVLPGQHQRFECFQQRQRHHNWVNSFPLLRYPGQTSYDG